VHSVSIGRLPPRVVQDRRAYTKLLTSHAAAADPRGYCASRICHAALLHRTGCSKRTKKLAPEVHAKAKGSLLSPSSTKAQPIATTPMPSASRPTSHGRSSIPVFRAPPSRRLKTSSALMRTRCPPPYPCCHRNFAADYGRDLNFTRRSKVEGRGPHARFWLPESTKLFEQRSWKYLEAPLLRLLRA
jgi:hypothetical protein